MIQMKEKIIEVLREHPGLRKREIAPYLHCHHFKILGAMSELQDAGLIKSIRIHDTASMASGMWPRMCLRMVHL